MKYLLLLVASMNFYNSSNAQPTINQLYNCTINKLDSQADYYELVFCDNNNYYFNLKIGYLDRISYECLSSGKFHQNVDTLILTDEFLKIHFHLLIRNNSLQPLKFFSIFRQEVFYPSLIKDHELCNDSSRFVAINYNQVKNYPIKKSNLHGTYVNTDREDIKRIGNKYYGNYTYKINLNTKGNFEYWIFDNLVFNGKWYVKDNRIHLFDEMLDEGFTLKMGQNGNLIPDRFPGNYANRQLFLLNRFKFNIELIKTSYKIETELPDE